MSKLVDFIHVGDYKTGTSWLQESVFPFHPEIQYLGDHFTNKMLKDVLRELVDIRDLDFDAEKLRATFSENLVKEKNKIIGMSREALSQSNYISGENARRNALRIKEVFGEVKIIYVIREQISMLASIYSQYLKTGGTRKFNDWFLDPIECKGIIERLKYDKNIKMYQEIFGEKNVKVLLFEELKFDKNNYLKKVYSFVGCTDVSFQPLASEKKVNTGLTTHGAFISRVLQGIFRNTYHNNRSSFLNLDKLIYSSMSDTFRKRMDLASLDSVIPSYSGLDRKQRILYSINMGGMKRIGQFSELIKSGKKIVIPHDIQEKIKPLFLESNRELQVTYQLDVDTYNWSV